MRHSYRRGAIGVAVAAVGLAAFAAPAQADSDTPSVALSGSVPSWAHASAVKGHASGKASVRLTVVLNLRDPQGAARLAAAVSDPRSASYGHYLSRRPVPVAVRPDERGRRQGHALARPRRTEGRGRPRQPPLGHRDRHRGAGRACLRHHHRLLRGRRRNRHRPRVRRQGPARGRRARRRRRRSDQPGPAQRSVARPARRPPARAPPPSRTRPRRPPPRPRRPRRSSTPGRARTTTARRPPPPCPRRTARSSRTLRAATSRASCAAPTAPPTWWPRASTAAA